MSKPGVSALPRHRTPVPSVSSPPKPTDEDDEEDYEDDGGRAAEDIGKTFIYRSVLSAAEAAALESFKRPSRDEEESELYPLPTKQRNATYGDIKQPLKSQSLGADSEALCIAASSTGNVLAVGGRHGTVQLLNPHTLEVIDTIRIAELAATSAAPTSNSKGSNSSAGGPQPAARGPRSGGALGSSVDGVVTALCFRPDTAASRMQNLLLAAQGDAIVHLHTGSHRVVHTAREEGNKINALAMRGDGKMFASAGSDCTVRVYDESTCTNCRTLDHGDGVTSHGHGNHVFSLAWQPDDPQVLLSGGWDNSVLVWDLRVHRSVRSIAGPHICGDALDVQPSAGSGASPGSGTSPLVLTGSWREAHPLQLWDLGTGRLLTNLPWWQPEPGACLPYAARFGTGRACGMVVAGGSGSKPMMRAYRLGSGPGGAELHYTMLLQRPVHALALVQPHAGAAAGGGKGGSGTPLAGGEAFAVVCCDNEVHAAPLDPGRGSHSQHH